MALVVRGWYRIQVRKCSGRYVSQACQPQLLEMCICPPRSHVEVGQRGSKCGPVVVWRILGSRHVAVSLKYASNIAAKKHTKLYKSRANEYTHAPLPFDSERGDVRVNFS